MAAEGRTKPGADEQYMRRALELARATVAQTSPNPRVGCVLVRDGIVVGEGSHIYENLDHAEIVALRGAGDRARGATAYVSLEPCSHTGRTGPCADALVAAGATRVVAATLDPNPLVAGKGAARLRAAGVRVEEGLLLDEARTLNDGFAWFLRTHRPYVTLKVALSADGKLAPARREGTGPVWVTGEAARAEVQRMRHASDAILTGVGTVLADDPALTDRTGSPRRRRLLRVVLDAELRTPVASQLVRSAAGDVLVFCGEDAAEDAEARLVESGVQVMRVRSLEGRLDLGDVLAELGAREMMSLLVEAGAQVNGALLRADLVGRVVLFRGTKRLGPNAVPFAEGVTVAEVQKRMQKVVRSTFGEDTCVAGYLHDAWKRADAIT